MSKTITFKYPTLTGPVEEQGIIALLLVGVEKHRFVMHAGYKLSDYRSGRLVTCYDHIKIRRMARISHHTKTSDRQAAQLALDEVIDRVGLEKFQAIVAAAEPLNGVKP
jgi:hypothetical protein